MAAALGRAAAVAALAVPALVLGAVAPAAAESVVTESVAVESVAAESVNACSSGRWPTAMGAWATCDYSSGQSYQVSIKCASVNPFNDSYWRSGPWVTSGLSNAWCKGIDIVGIVNIHTSRPINN